jgi:hypothetical protein
MSAQVEKSTWPWYHNACKGEKGGDKTLTKHHGVEEEEEEEGHRCHLVLLVILKTNKKHNGQQSNQCFKISSSRHFKQESIEFMHHYKAALR